MSPQVVIKEFGGNAVKSTNGKLGLPIEAEELAVPIVLDVKP